MPRNLIVVVDDAEDLREIMCEVLADEGYQVAAFPDAVSMWAGLPEQRPALFVIDVLLPGVTGWELARHVRVHYGEQPVPILLCTALTAETMAPEFAGHPETALIEKPFNLDDFLEAISRLLRDTA
ncbi:MAG: response regulator [Chloroflexi bacterium]|nr:response regulator [Chloroflexota bacterium]